MFWRGYQLKNEWTLSGLSQFDSHHVPAAQRAPEAGRALRAQVRRLSLHLGRRVPDEELALRLPGRRRLRLLGLRLLRDEDALRLRQHHREPARGPRHGRRRQAAHHAQEAHLRRPDLLRTQRHQVVGRVHLPRRALPWERLVHPVHRLDRRRLARLARQSTYWKNAFAWGRRLLTPAELGQTPVPALRRRPRPRRSTAQRRPARRCRPAPPRSASRDTTCALVIVSLAGARIPAMSVSRARRLAILLGIRGRCARRGAGGRSRRRLYRSARSAICRRCGRRRARPTGSPRPSVTLAIAAPKTIWTGRG